MNFRSTGSTSPEVDKSLLRTSFRSPSPPNVSPVHEMDNSRQTYQKEDNSKLGLKTVIELKGQTNATIIPPKKASATKKPPIPKGRRSLSSAGPSKIKSMKTTEQSDKLIDTHAPKAIPVEVFASTARVDTPSDSATDVPMPEEVAILKAQLTNAAEPLSRPNEPMERFLINSQENTQRETSPPLVRTSPHEYLTLDEVGKQNTATTEVKPIKNTRKILKKEELTKLKPPSLSAQVQKEEKESLIHSEKSHPTTASPAIEHVGSSLVEVANTPSPVMVRSIERKAKKPLKKASEVVRANRQLSSNEEPTANEPIFREPVKAEEDVDVFEDDQLDEELQKVCDDAETVNSNLSEEANDQDQSSESSEDNLEFHEDEDESQIFEENESWWRWTAMATDLFYDIDQLKMRLLERVKATSKLNGKKEINGMYSQEINMAESARALLFVSFINKVAWFTY